MKQCIKTSAATLSLILGVSILSFGQNMYAENSEKASNTAIAVAKKAGRTENITTVNSTIATIFSTLFPNATEQKWSEKDTYHLVFFLNSGRKATACFSPKGKMSYAIIECGMEQLPETFSSGIKKNYASYHLLQATEIRAYDQTAYQAIMENASGFVTLKYTADGVEEIKTVKK